MRIDRVNEAMVHTLTHELRTATVQHLADGLELSAGAVSARVRRLRQNDQVHTASPILRVLTVDRPLYASADGRLPNFTRLAWQLRKRWDSATAVQTTIVWASSRAARRFGGHGGRLRQPQQLEHDLCVAAAWCHWRNQGASGTWISEDVYRDTHQRGAHRRSVPDALVLDDQGNIVKYIEIGGRYSVKRLKKIHRTWTPYELW